eukprot:SAG31_NODE_16807_length_695_cov_0.775168_1_plen_231_part_11
MHRALALYRADGGPFNNVSALYNKEMLYSAVESETASRGQMLRTAMGATDARIAQQKLSALRADLTLTLRQASGSKHDDEDQAITCMLEENKDSALHITPLHEFVQKYKHAKKRMDAATGALVFIADVKAIDRIRKLDDVMHRKPHTDEPRTAVMATDIVRTVSNLKMAVLGLGLSAASQEAKDDARHRLGVFQSALTAVSAVRTSIRNVTGTSDAVMAIESLISNQEQAQ